MIPEFTHFDRLPSGTVLVGYRGSVAHGTYRPSSETNSTDDIDIMSIHVGPIEHYLGFRRKNIETIESFEDEWDIVSYEIRHFVEMLAKCNPNVLQLLFLPDELIISSDVIGDTLRSNAHKFLSKRLYHTTRGYAHSQLQKLEKDTHKGYMGAKRKGLVKQFGFDTKYASHVIRILQEGVGTLREGTFTPAPDPDMLVDIKNGRYSQKWVEVFADHLFNALKLARDESPLPDEVDMAEIESLLMECIAVYHWL